jgi:hypothetical protein
MGSFGGGTISLVGAVAVISAPLMITGAILGLSSTLTRLFINSDKEENPIISVFNKLYNA